MHESLVQCVALDSVGIVVSSKFNLQSCDIVIRII